MGGKWRTILNTGKFRTGKGGPKREQMETEGPQSLI